MNIRMSHLLALSVFAMSAFQGEATALKKATSKVSRKIPPTFMQDVSGNEDPDEHLISTNYTLRAASVGVNFDLDVLGIASTISDSISSAQNRDAFVINLANTAFYAAGSRYHVMVFNLNVEHAHGLEGVQSYGSASYDGIIFGIWVFEGGWFRNDGDGGYINWAFIGWFDRTDGFVDFH